MIFLNILCTFQPYVEHYLKTFDYLVNICMFLNLLQIVRKWKEYFTLIVLAIDESSRRFIPK